MARENRDAGLFAVQVARRLEHVETYVQDFVRGKPSSSLLPLWNLRALQDECRQAGRQDISALCQQLEHRIMALQTGCWENRDRLAAEIVAAGDDIQHRAHDRDAIPAALAAEAAAGMMEVSLA